MNFANDSEHTTDLLQQISDGSSDALDELLNAHRPFLQRVVSMRMDPEIACRVDPSDVVQETLVVITKRIDDFLNRRPTSFRMWIRRKALERLVDQRRLHINARKRSVRRERRFTDSSMEIARTLLSDTPSKIFRRNELQVQIHDLIEELRENDREILKLRHAEGLSSAEVADVLQISLNTVRQRYGRALRRLHERLTELGISPDSEAC